MRSHLIMHVWWLEKLLNWFLSIIFFMWYSVYGINFHRKKDFECYCILLGNILKPLNISEHILHYKFTVLYNIHFKWLVKYITLVLVGKYLYDWAKNGWVKWRLNEGYKRFLTVKLGHAVQYIYLSAYLLSFSSVIYNTDCSCKSLKRWPKIYIYITVQKFGFRFLFLKEINTFIQQGCSILIRSDR